MPLTALSDVLDPAFEHRYGVAAFNVVNDLTLEAVLAAAQDLASPVIVQTSLKTVKAYGAPVLFAMVAAMAERTQVPVALHLDHCPEREWASTCLRAGWNSVLFDGSSLDVEENARQTAEVVREARGLGAHVEGEIETVGGVEDDVGSDEAGAVQPVEVSVSFIDETGIYAFAPAIGTAHGLYAGNPELTPERVSELVAQRPIPMVLHGGTGLAPEQFQDLIARGCAKVNISTAIKIAYMDGTRSYLEANPTKQDPPALFAHVRERVQAVAADHMRIFGSAGKATAAAAPAA
jgi:fructose-bisphosphate aldolase class II